MKEMLRTMVLATAGFLGSVAVAQAQQPAQPPPPAPPVGQPAPAPQPPPPPADFGVAPAALPAAPVGNLPPPPSVTFGTQPGADPAAPGAAAAPEKPKKKNPFRLTRFNWTNNASPKIFGLGRDYISKDDETYSMDFTLDARYYLYDKPVHQIFVRAQGGFSVELTNSDTTRTLREPLARDTSIGLGYGVAFFKKGDWSTSGLFQTNAALPTSKASQGVGRYMNLNVSATLLQNVPLAKSDWLSDIFFVPYTAYQHQFTKATVPTNDIATKYPRASAGNAEFRSDQTAGSAFNSDSMRFGLGYYLTIYKDLSFNNTWEIQVPFRYELPNSTVTLATGPVDLGPAKSRQVPVTTFDVGFSYTMLNTVRLDLGYTNSTGQIGPDGKRRSVFYSPDSQFYANVSIYIDTLLWKAINPETGTGGARIGRAGGSQYGSF